MKPMLPWLLLACAVAYIAAGALRSPDTTEADAYKAEAAQAKARADSAAAEAVKARQALADSVMRWRVERARLSAVVRVEEASHAASADTVRSRVDSATAAIVDRMEQDFAVAIDAERAKAETWKAEAKGLRVQLSIADREIVALRNTIAVKDTETALLRASLSDAGPGTLHRIGDVLAWGYTGTQIVRALIGVAAPS